MTWLSRYKLRKELLASLKLIVSSKLSDQEKTELKKQLSLVKGLIEFQDYKSAKEKIREFQTTVLEKLRPPFWIRSLGWIGGICIALILALLIRQEWFELYEIPSGSMRPTLRESDRLSVSKTSFGINLPFSTGHIWFDPNLVKRSQIITFTGENMDIPDVNTTYFGLIPGKRQFVKRLCGKPLDTVYFQGGQLTGFSSLQEDLFSAFNPPYLGSIDRVPLIGFEWNVVAERQKSDQSFDASLYYLMNEPVLYLKKDPYNTIRAEWVKNSLFQGMDARTDFYDLMGIKNYAQTRIVWNFEKETSKESPLVFEMRHHPSLKGARMEVDFYGRLRPILHYSTSQILLSESMINELFSKISTGRFSLLAGRILRYPYTNKQIKQDKTSRLENIPDGVYEFINGKAYKIGFAGVAQALAEDHPLLQKTPARLALFYNLGYEFDERVNPAKNKAAYPNRFAYFRDGDLYVQGYLFLASQDQVLVQFAQHELSMPSKDPLHIPFTAERFENDEAYKEQIMKFGLKIPEGHYLALGDNPPVSSDSRDFGMLPEGNLRGSPAWIFWPPGPRWGIPSQPEAPLVNPGRAFVWVIAICGIGSWIYFERKKKKNLPKWEDL